MQYITLLNLYFLEQDSFSYILLLNKLQKFQLLINLPLKYIVKTVSLLIVLI